MNNKSKVQHALVRDIMTDQVLTVSTEDVVTRVHELFSEMNIHHLPVIDRQSEIAGIISRIDLNTVSAGFSVFKQHRREEYNEALYRSLRAVEIMTPDPQQIAPDAPIKEAIEKFKENVFRALPVVLDRKVVGIITPYDIMMFFSEHCK